MMPVNPMSISAILNKPSELRKDGPQTPEEEEKTSAENKKMKRREKRKVNTASVKVAHAPSAQILYQVTGDGAAQLRPILVDRAAAWESLSVVSSAHLPRWTIHRGDIVIVDIGPKGMDYAKVSDLRRLSDGRYVIVYAWLYTRNEIARQLEVDAKLPAHAPVHLDSMWRPNAEHKMMLSTNRTMMIWDTAIAKAPKKITMSTCQYAIYNTTPLSRRIVSVDRPYFQWVRAILTMKPETQ
ncbi:uncharacterized protein N7484_006071 [Penicillium longicatenatum]|uniref:uncharacterized protein n=1 Tax=Penicillium longicatenatum TaxID=1561947 RepID=UPI00254931A1|nr:uncharacterized protein N7484_006071 [Penicillium longicatenatum]KAJ5643564.1 hypothetical protein N7484_006071 [Penicillium longicatenatum]